MNQIEIDIAAYLLDHGDALLATFQKRLNPHRHLFPDFYIDVYEDSYRDCLLKELQNALMKELNLNYEQINLIVTKGWVKLVLGNKFFELPRDA